MMESAPASRLAQVSARWLARTVIPFRFERPVVSISFDDFPRSALDRGGRLLEAKGVAGTFYTALGLADSETAVGPVGRLAELAACVERGHEIACHTYDHLDCFAATGRQIDKSLAANQAVARDLGLPPLRHFAYPFGRYGVTAKKIAMRHYASARGISWGVNRGDIDLGLLKSVALYAHFGQARWDPYLAALQSGGGWLIFYTHDVATSPSPYGCTPEDLNFVLRRAGEIGATVLPVGAVVDKLLAVSRTGKPRENAIGAEKE
jgi:peptidoglycan/xylan/chitin deacetylase (PgdA/CDA1 family)